MTDDNDGLFLDLPKFIPELRDVGVDPKLLRELAQKTGIDEATLEKLYRQHLDTNFTHLRGSIKRHLKKAVDDIDPA